MSVSDTAIQPFDSGSKGSCWPVLILNAIIVKILLRYSAISTTSYNDSLEARYSLLMTRTPSHALDWCWRLYCPAFVPRRLICSIPRLLRDHHGPGSANSAGADRVIASFSLYDQRPRIPCAAQTRSKHCKPPLQVAKRSAGLSVQSIQRHILSTNVDRCYPLPPST